MRDKEYYQRSAGRMGPTSLPRPLLFHQQIQMRRNCFSFLTGQRGCVKQFRNWKVWYKAVSSVDVRRSLCCVMGHITYLVGVTYTFKT